MYICVAIQLFNQNNLSYVQKNLIKYNVVFVLHGL